MPSQNILKYGVLRARDLAELYYGWRLVGVALPIVQIDTSSATPQQILQPDPRRYKWIVTMCNDGGNSVECIFGRSSDVTQGTGVPYTLATQTTLEIQRNWLADLDVVTDELWMLVENASVRVAIQQFILTPAPVDEVPLA